jgi:NADPH-dependent F420 reductase
MTCIGFLGGTGVEAQGLALRFAAAGASVFLGSRSPQRAVIVAETCNAILGKPLLCGLGNREMLDTSKIVFLTVPFEQAVDAVEGCRSLLGSHHILVDVTVPMVFRAGHAVYIEQEGRSNSEIIADHLPDGVPLVAAFKTIPALILADLQQNLNCSLFVCSDTGEAKQTIIEAASLIPSLHPLDGGPLHMARTLERMTVLAAELNRRYKKKGARYRIEGI